VSLRGRRREGSLPWLLGTTLLPGCFPSFEVTSDGGADAARDRTADHGSSGSEVGSSHRDGNSDGADAAKDASTCVSIIVTPPEPTHGGPACPVDGSTCWPADVTTFSPTWVPPQTKRGACTTTQINDLYAYCVGPASTKSGCATWASANKDCYECAYTTSTDSHYGPLLEFTGPMNFLVVNFPGCIAAAEPCNVSCAMAGLADFQCDLAACNFVSGACVGSSQSVIQQCYDQADSTCGCEGYHLSQLCFQSMLADPASHPAATLCALGQVDSFVASYQAIAAYMCGPPG